MSQQPQPTAAEVDDPALLAVIAAAVDVVLQQPATVVSVRHAPEHFAWAAEGRRSHFSSHSPR